MGKLAQKALLLRLRGGVALGSLCRRPFKRFLSPFGSGEPAPIIIHCCYHKIGTVWFIRMLRAVAAEFGLSFGIGSNYQKICDFEVSADKDIFVDVGSHVRLDQLPPYRASHMIRDPRDTVVSGYFYHLWTNEAWANLPRAEYRGMSYREYLNSLSRKEGLLAEVETVRFWVPHMVEWNYQNPDVFEIKYEDIMSDEPATLRRMFEHYGFKESAVERSCRIAEAYSFRSLKKLEKSGSGGKSHLRSGRLGEWRENFDEEHKALFKQLYPGAVVALGYECDDNW